MDAEKQDRIRLAAQELSAALTDHGGDFYVTADGTDVTTYANFSRQYVWTVRVKLCAEKILAP